MNYKQAWAFDIDGTLINNHKIMGFNGNEKFNYKDFIARSYDAPVVESVIEKVREANEMEIPVVVITARCDDSWVETLDLLERLECECGITFDYVYQRPVSYLPEELKACVGRTNADVKEIIHNLHGQYKVDVIKEFEDYHYPYVITEMFEDAYGILEHIDELAVKCNWVDEEGNITYDCFGGKHD